MECSCTHSPSITIDIGVNAGHSGVARDRHGSSSLDRFGIVYVSSLRVGTLSLAIISLIPFPSLLNAHSHLAMPTALSLVSSLFCLFLIRHLLGLRKVTRSVGSVRLRSRDNQSIDLQVNLIATSPVHSSFLSIPQFQGSW